MIRFEDFRRNLLAEGTRKVGSKKQYTGEVVKRGNRYVAFIDGEELESAKTEKAAWQVIQDFIELAEG